MKRFFEFLKQAFLGDSKGLGSKTANMTVDQLVKVGTDMKIGYSWRLRFLMVGLSNGPMRGRKCPRT